MQLMLVRNATPGPLVLVDERGGDKQEYKWEPEGSPMGECTLEVPEALASNVNFRRNVQKGNLVIEQHIEQDALMGPTDQDWIARQRALASGGVPTQVMGETRTADGVPVIVDKESAAPISTMTLDADGNIVQVADVPAEQRQQQRGRAIQQQPQQAPQQQSQQQAPAPPPIQPPEPVVTMGPPVGYVVPEQQQQSQPQPEQQIEDAEIVPQTAGGHLDPNAP